MKQGILALLQFSKRFVPVCAGAQRLVLGLYLNVNKAVSGCRSMVTRPWISPSIHLSIAYFLSPLVMCPERRVHSCKIRGAKRTMTRVRTSFWSLRITTRSSSGALAAPPCNPKPHTMTPLGRYLYILNPKTQSPEETLNPLTPEIP